MNKPALGRASFSVGVVLLLTSLLTWIFLDAPTVAVVKAALGAVAVAYGVLATGSQVDRVARGRSAFFLTSTAGLVGALLVVLVGVNYIAAKRNKTWDITSKKVNSLAPQTTGALTNLKEKVTALAFADPKDPMFGAMEALLQRYRSEAPEKFEYAFKTPLKSPDLVAKYQLRQGQDAIVLTRGEGAAESHVMVPLPTEQELTNGLLKLSSVGEKKVYFLAGHGEWSLEGARDPEGQGQPRNESSILELNRDLTQEGYAPQVLNLAGKTEVPKDCSVLIVAGPKQAVTAPEAEAIKKYLAEGGRLALFTDEKVETGLEKVLADYGLQVDPGLVADAQFAVESPYRILSVFYGNHEVTRLLRSAQMNTIFPTTRGITLLRDGVPAGVKAEPLVLSSPEAWEESNPNEDPQPSNGEKTGQIALAAVSVKPVAADAKDKRNDEARVVLFGDSTLLVDAYWGHEGNRNLVLNAIAWASNQFQKVTIRPPDRDISTIDMDAERQSRVRLVAFDLYPLAWLVVGLTIWAMRRNK